MEIIQETRCTAQGQESRLVGLTLWILRIFFIVFYCILLLCRKTTDIYVKTYLHTISESLPFQMIMLTSFRWTPAHYIHVRKDRASWEFTTGSCKYGLALAFSKSPKAAEMPLDFWTTVHSKAEVMQKSASLMVPHAHTAAEEETECQMSLPSGGKGNKRNPMNICGQLIMAVIVNPQRCSRSAAPVFFFVRLADFGLNSLQRLTLHGYRPWLAGLQSPELLIGPPEHQANVSGATSQYHHYSSNHRHTGGSLCTFCLVYLSLVG